MCDCGVGVCKELLCEQPRDGGKGVVCLWMSMLYNVGKLV